MHIFFSGIGGTAIGPLAMIAQQAGYTVSGSDKRASDYISYLQKQGISQIQIGQTTENIAALHREQPIDWIVYSSAVAIENPNHPELVFAREHGIKQSKRDELLNKILQDTGKKLFAVAGTHGKTTTTAMAIWLFKQLNYSLSYSVGAKLSFGDMGHFDADSEYFVYECDEFDRNFLAFHPHISLITGIDHDHHEIFPTRQDYLDAFTQFMDQSERNVVWEEDMLANQLEIKPNFTVLSEQDPTIEEIRLAGLVNRKNAWQVIEAVRELTGEPLEKLIGLMHSFPGLSRRFEQIATNLYTDYAHTVPKIAGCLQMAREISPNVVVVYEPLTDRRQHYIKQDYANLFADIKKLYWVPSYLAREDNNQAVLSPEDLIPYMHNPQIAEPADLNQQLKAVIEKHLTEGDLVVCISGGGGDSLDEWLRREFKV